MNEKAYKTMSRIGGWNIAIGVVALVTGIAIGIGSIITVAKLLKDKSNITFQEAKYWLGMRIENGYMEYAG